MNDASHRISMPKSRPLNSLISRRTSQLRPEEISALTAVLLEYLPQAALLVDLEEEKVLLCNTAALRMTAFSRQEILSLKPDQIFPAELHTNGRHFLDYDLHELNRQFRCHIVIRNGSTLPVEISPVLMDTVIQPAAQGQQPAQAPLNAGGRLPRYLVLHIELLQEVERRQKSAIQREHQRENLNRLTNSLAELVRCPDENCRKRTLEATLQHAARLTGMEALAVYWWQAGSVDTPGDVPAIAYLAMWAEQEDVQPFPETLSLVEIQAVRAPTRWSKGKRMAYGLQQRLRSAGYGFSKLIPLFPGNGHAARGDTPSHENGQGAQVYRPPIQTAGLLVGVAGKNPEEENLVNLQMVANLIAQVLMFSARQASLQTALARLSEANELSVYVKDMLFDCILLINSELRILDANQAAMDILEYKRHEMIGQDVGQILISEQRFPDRAGASLVSGGATTDGQALFLKQLGDAFQLSAATQPQQIKLYRRSGAAFLANYRLVPVNRIAPRSGMFLILQDLSELEYFRKENEQLNQRALLGEITSSFAHEIRNPINSLSSGIQLLLATVSDDFSDRPVLEDLQVDLDRLTRIVDSGLAFFRKKEYQMSPVRIDRLVNRLQTSAWQHRLHRYKAKIEVLVSGDIPPIQGDESALEHVFTNLFDNAVDAMSDNPPNQPRNIIIKLAMVKNEHQQDLLEIWISDTGPGIPDALVERIFDPFFTTKTKGTGVGLSIVRRIVSAHGGTIAITHNVGGTTFRLRLPVPRRSPENGSVITITD